MAIWVVGSALDINIGARPEATPLYFISISYQEYQTKYRKNKQKILKIHEKVIISFKLCFLDGDPYSPGVARYMMGLGGTADPKKHREHSLGAPKSPREFQGAKNKIKNYKLYRGSWKYLFSLEKFL